ncbi:hypothetical protein GGD81_001426 [Rhodobium orientis]|uniref:DUF3035 domain-containing protein n=1 Tax=Rhodobium orientis TaxID=34017 RepID=A0A327JML0_9HYPH|nr:hypothetical protein [Rhodobium orientis]MBB4302399.1 hypothetical protein [Rhodobium orientis]MBK5949103.1 hypothetical protein [Rhodobium orientis]RAI26574.1 hypothetical protein CH339_13280 [Rhodobium orientis]
MTDQCVALPRRGLAALFLFLGALTATAGAVRADDGPMQLLPEGFLSGAPVGSDTAPAPTPGEVAPATVRPPAPTDRAEGASVFDPSGRPALLKDDEKDRTIDDLRALAARNAARAGARGPAFANRLKRLGESHGKEALSEIEEN